MANVRLAQSFSTQAECQTETFEDGEGCITLYDFTADQWYSLTASEWFSWIAADTFNPTKVALFLRSGGKSSRRYFLLESENVIDSTNFYSLDQGDSVKAFVEYDETEGGVLRIGSTSASADKSLSDCPKITFYVRGTVGKWYANIRSSVTTNYNLELYIDDVVVSNGSGTVGSASYDWNHQLSFVLPDEDEHKITIVSRRTGIAINKIQFSTSSTVPTGDGDEYTDSPYATVHVGVFSSQEDGTPTTALTVYDYKNSHAHVTVDDYYSFDATSYADPISYDGVYSVVLSASGGSEKHFVTWDFADGEPLFPSASHDGTDWSVDEEKSFATMIYSGKAAHDGDCYVNTPIARPATLRLNEFSPSKSTFANTKIDDDEYSDTHGQVVLDLGKNTVSFVVDMSGSMSWNDPSNSRIKLAQRMVNRLAASYPGELSYNLYAYRGDPVETVFFGTTQDLGKDDVHKINSNYFKSEDKNVAGIRVVRRDDRYPDGPIDGDEVAHGLFSKVLDEGLTPGQTYYYTIYSFDKNEHFSEGVRMKAVALPRQTVRGVSYVKTGQQSGTGVELDDSVLACWHMNEREGDEAYDFTGNGCHLSVGSGAVWLNSQDVPIGHGGLRLDGGSVNVRTGASPDTSLSGTGSVTVLMWVYPYGDGVLVVREDGTNFNYGIRINSSTIEVSLNGTAWVSTGATVSTGQWSHVAVAIDNLSGTATAYVNGAASSSVAVSAAGSSNGSSLYVRIGDSTVSPSPFAGKVTEVSIHDGVRSGNYVSAAAQPNTNEVQDNGDRVVVLRYTIPDAVSGTLVLVSHQKHLPGHPEDGDVLVEETATAGDHVYVDSRKFNTGKSYYRFFVRSAEGNYSALEDSAGVTVSVISPDSFLANIDPVDPELSPVEDFSAQAGNGKVYLEWYPSSDPRVTTVKVYCSTSTYPTVDETVFSGTEIFVGDDEEEDYVHRGLVNGQTYYYTIVALNKFNQISSVLTADAVPSAAITDVGIPIQDVVSARFENVSDTSVLLSWTNPFGFTRDVTAYFDETVYLYGTVLDEYGNPIKDLGKVSISATPVANFNGVDNPFAENPQSSIDLTESYDVTTSYDSSGLIRGRIDFRGNGEDLSNIDSVTFSVKLVVSKPDEDSPLDANGERTGNVFSYTSPSINVVMHNPVRVNLTNAYNDKFFDRITNQAYDGAYIRRNNPFSVRLETLFKGEPVQDVSFRLAAIDLDGAQSEIVTLDDTTYSSGGTSLVVPVTVPDVPASVYFYASGSFNGYEYVTRLPVRFENILQIQVSPQVPVADGIEAVEQFAQAWVVNPDIPSETSPVPNDTVVKWEINTDTRPFYSTDTVDLPNGVYSYSFEGTARDVYFGPVSDVPEGGEAHTVTVSIVYDGLSASSSGEIRVEDGTADLYMLMETDDGEMWGDGQDYVKVTIVHDPNSTPSSKSDYFLQSMAAIGKDIAAMSAGQLVTVTADGFEIIAGDVEESVDPYTGEDVLELGEDSETGVGTLTIKLSDDDKTHFYLRRNTAQTVSVAVRAVSTDTVDGQLRSWAGGVYPQVNVTATNPLKIRFVDTRFDGHPSDMVAVDGSSVNTLYFNVSFSGRPVPDGTPVTLSGEGVVSIIDVVAYTRSRNDNYINPDGEEASFSQHRLNPFVKTDDTFSASVTATVQYDRIGSVERTERVKVNIYYSPDNEARWSTSAAFSGSLYRYNVGSGTWTTLSDLDQPRGALVAQYVGGALYAMGGTDGRTISAANEKWDGSNWEYASDLPTARYYATSCVSGTDIYVIGGITQNRLEGRLLVSQSVEKYDTLTDTWTTLADMPDIDVGEQEARPYGVAMGVSAVVSGKIYVMCGMTEIKQDSVDKGNRLVGAYNDRVLIYDISTDTWDYTEPFDGDQLSVLSRLSPGHFVRSGKVRVFGGVWYDETAEDFPIKDQTVAPPVFRPMAEALSYVTDSFSFDPSFETVEADDGDYGALPGARYKSACASVGTNAYVFGGSSRITSTSRSSERVDASGDTSSMADLPKGLNSAAAAGDGTNVFVVGGISSGRDPEFLKIELSTSSDNMPLDGRRSETIKVVVSDENGEAPASVNVLVSPYFVPNQANRTSSTVPVALSQEVVTVTDGNGATVLMPRSDDRLVSADESAGKIVYEGTVLDGSYHGATKLFTTETQPEPLPVIDVNATTVTLYGSSQTESQDRGVFVNSSQAGESVFDLTPPILLQLPCGELELVRTKNWIPRVLPLVSGNDGSASDMTDQLSKLDSHVPFGGSPVGDAVYAVCLDLFDANGDKVVYILGDGDESLSSYPTLEVSSQLGSVTGCTAVAVSFTAADPAYVSARRGAVESTTFRTLIDEAGGESYGVVSGSDMNTVVDEVIGTVPGGVGYGVFEYVLDLGEVAPIKKLEPKFHLYENSSATWKFSVSDDGEQYTDLSEPFVGGTAAEFTSLSGRYVRFVMSLSTGISRSSDAAREGDGAAVPPSLYQIEVRYHEGRTVYLFMNAESLEGDGHDFVVTVDADAPELSEISVGLTTDDVASWGRLYGGAKPLAGQSGRIVIPNRLIAQDGLDEPLDHVDGYMFRCRSGKWDPNSDIAVFDSSGDEVDADKYVGYADKGTVVFGERQSGPFTFRVRNKNVARVGIKVTNHSIEQPVTIKGVSFSYSLMPEDDGYVG